MSSERRAPWWYSGEDDSRGDSPGDGRVDGEAAPEATAEAASGDASPAMDWAALAAGAVRMVDWATERVLAPHAEHTDPADHPECMVCRTVTLIGDPVGLLSPAETTGAATTGSAAATGAQPIRWIPIVEDRS